MGYVLIEEAYQCMRLRKFKIVAPIQRIKPRIKQESRPFSPFHDEAPWHETLLILSNYQVDVLLFQVAERFDDAIRWDDWNVLQHERFQTLFIEDV